MGVAVKTGDCFFDLLVQRLNEPNIKPDYHFTTTSLRENCANYAEKT